MTTWMMLFVIGGAGVLLLGGAALVLGLCRAAADVRDVGEGGEFGGEYE